MLFAIVLAAGAASAPATSGAPDGGPVADFNAGVAAEGNGDLAAATALLERAQAGLPRFGLAKLELAEVLLKTGGQVERALALVAAAETVEPGNPRLFHLRALAFAEQGNAAAVEASERRALGLRPDYREADLTLAQALWDEGKHDEALQHWETLAHAAPLDTSTRALLIDRWLEAGKPVEAEKELRQLAADQPKNPVWHRRLARTLEAEGLRAEADEERDRAAELGGQPVVKRKLRRLPDSRR